MGGCKSAWSFLSLVCWRIEWALKHKGIDYEYIEQDLRNKSTLLLKSSPRRNRHNHLLPEDPLEKAMVRFWAKYVDDKCVLDALAASRAKGSEQKKAVNSAQESLKLLEKLIEGKKLFGGETIGFLDLVVGSLPNWLRLLEGMEGIKLFDSEKLPLLHEWAQRFTEIPIIKECMPKTEDLISCFRAQRIGK
ncbi:S-crystallin [Parasponia andersonii]|uniref:glutathione transferase n=1 Tax=Parasponia andersonii TaxID=3476 RepID=A0A2P5DEZ1_PARAD|nr:S-crystallin [Parasponia andersonii]